MKRSTLATMLVFVWVAVAAVGVYLEFGLGWALMGTGAVYAVLFLSVVDVDEKGEKT